MTLYEEYIARHGLDVPVVGHSESDRWIFFKGKEWVILSVVWLRNASHPGKYRIDFYDIVERAHRTGRIIEPTSGFLTLEWSQLQPYVLNQRLGEAIYGQERAELAAWDIFSKSIREWIDDECDVGFRRLHRDSLSDYKRYSAASRHLSDRYPFLYRMYYDQLAYNLRYYSHALAKLAGTSLK